MFKLVFMLLLTFSFQAHANGREMLPDLITSPLHLFDNRIDTTTLPGRKLFRFANATPNFGRGRLELQGGEINEEGTQNVYQIIFKTDGSSLSRLAGVFDYHPEHHHTHFGDYANYQLRKVKFLIGVGRIVAESSKISFCIRDSSIAYPLLPGFKPTAHYKECGNTVQGIGVGWMDVYGKELPGQWIDVTDLKKGRYWLESIVDPYDRIKESNENNNLSRVMVYLH